jgi:hypothetical protein
MSTAIVDRSRELRRTCRDWRRRRVVAGLRAAALAEKNHMLRRRSLGTLQAVDERRLRAALRLLEGLGLASLLIDPIRPTD